MALKGYGGYLLKPNYMKVVDTYIMLSCDLHGVIF